MSHTRPAYDLDPVDAAVPPMGLIVLSVDETIESEFRQCFAEHPGALYVSRIASATEVSRDSLAAMAPGLAHAADLLPKSRPYPVVGYGCTSASAVLGSERVEAIVQETCAARVVTNPLRATIAHSAHLGLSNLALLSPYVEEVSDTLRARFADAGLSTDVFASFGEATEANVARICRHSIVEAATRLGADPHVEAVFLSCTNLRTLDAIPEIAARIGKPVLSSNLSLAWHMKSLANA